MDKYPHNKFVDAIIGIFINLFICALAFNIYLVLNGLDSKFALVTTIILFVVFDFFVIRKLLKARKFIAIGMIIAIFIPLLIVLLIIGTCSSLF